MARIELPPASGMGGARRLGAAPHEFWARLRPHFAEDELADLIICCGMFLGLGRAMAVVGVQAPHERIIV